MKVSEKYLDSKKEQSEIKGALEKAIPKNIHFQNLIIALSEMMRQECIRMLEGETGVLESDFINKVSDICYTDDLHTDATITDEIKNSIRKDYICQVGNRIFINKSKYITLVNGDDVENLYTGSNNET